MFKQEIPTNKYVGYNFLVIIISIAKDQTRKINEQTY